MQKKKKYFFKIKDFYDKRSKYIHGNTPLIITKENEFDLREIVREVLLNYWYISMFYNIDKAEDMLIFIDNNTQNTIDLQVQLFIKALHMTNYQTFYAETRQQLISGKTNILDYKNQV